MKTFSYCSYPGCPVLHADGEDRRCPKHRPPKRKRLPAHLRGDDAFYSRAAWRRYRKWFLARHPFCDDCGRVAVDVHHILDRRQNPGAALRESNCMALCHACHSRRTATVSGDTGERQEESA